MWHIIIVLWINEFFFLCERDLLMMQLITVIFPSKTIDKYLSAIYLVYVHILKIQGLK